MRKILVLIFLSFIPVSCVIAEEVQTKLEEINQKVDEDTELLVRLKTQCDAADRDVTMLQGSIKKLEAKEAGAKKELVALKTSRSLLEDELSKTKGEIARIQDVAVKRVRAVYMNRGNSLLQSVLYSAGGGGDSNRNAVYLESIHRFDDGLVKNLASLQEKNVEEGRRLDELVKKSQSLADQLVAQKQEISLKAAEKRELLDSLKKHRAEINQTLTSLRAQALRLETVVQSITGGGEAERTIAKNRSQSTASTELERFDGSGLGAGRIAPPVQGRVVRGYGKYKSPDFSEPLMNKGIDYRVSAGAEARAVAKGRVIFVGKMPDFGNIVIVDHGARDYTLYGRLPSPTVSVGDLVNKGDSLGEAGEPDSQGRNFYFEVRHEGVPVDPSRFLR